MAIRLQAARTATIGDLRDTLQRAIQLEFATLPPYLYAMYTVGENKIARDLILDVVHEEMIHMMLACNILNSLDGSPLIANATVVPTYPGPLPFSIGSEDDEPFIVHLYHFSKPAMEQAAKIEEPENPINIKSRALAAAEPEFHTIGQFYEAVKAALPSDGWVGKNQIGDATAFPGELFAIASKADAEKAIDNIVSQGEGTDQGTEASPLDFEGEVSHYYRFNEILRNQVLEKAPEERVGYRWGAPLGVDFEKAVAAIDNPGDYNFANDPAAKARQDDCNRSFTEMLDELQKAVSGEPDRLGNAVRKMFDLSQAAHAAIETPLAENPGLVAGPAFLYRPELIN